MSILVLGPFSGVVPRLSAKLLPIKNAQTAENCKLWSGNLRAFNGLTTGASLTKTGPILSAYLFDDTKWFHWASDVDVVRGQLPLNSTERTYFTGIDYPRYTDNTLNGGADYPTNSYQLAITVNGTTTPAPTVGGTASDADNVEARVYVYTWVRTWQGIAEESEPSDPSSVISLTPGDTCNLTNLPTAAPIASDPGAVWTKKIYRTLSGTDDTDYQYVASLALGSSTYDDSALGEALGEVLPSVTWSAPPSDLVGLTPMPNGIMAAFRRNEIWFCEPYQPHAWPVDYQLSTDSPIVALAAFGESLVVATEGHPYVVTGIDPATMSMGKLELAQACVSKRSMVDLGPFVVYASPDGLVSVGPGFARVITSEFMTRDEWQALVPSSIHAYRYDDRYIGFYNTGAVTGGFIFDPAEGDRALVFTDEYCDTAYTDLETDTLYLVKGISPVVYSWDTNTGSKLTYTWRSKVSETRAPLNMGAAQVLGEQTGGSTVEFKLFADGVLKHTETVSSEAPFRLPGGYMATDWEIQVVGSATVDKILVASTIRELRQV